MPTTGVPAIDWVLQVLAHWGYLVVAAFTIFENLFVVGSVTPGETMVIAAAAVSANAELMLRYVWLASVFGTITGSNLSYLFGRRIGLVGLSDFVRSLAKSRLGRLVRVDPTDLDDVRTHFHTQGARTVFISRFAVGAKNFVPAMAGATRMPVFWFEAYTALGAITYTSLMCAIGWYLGNNLPQAIRIASSVGWVGLAVLVSFMALLWYGRRRYTARRSGGDTTVTTRDAVLKALRDAGDAGVSGEALADQLGISRVAIGKHVSALERAGYAIDAKRGVGYTLISAPDLALPGEVAPLVSEEFYVEMLGDVSTGSTNADARALARAGADEGTVVVAGSQKAGAGRLGRSWTSPPGGAYLSVVLRPEIPPSRASELPIVIALGVVEALENLGVDAKLKWPNDIYVGEKKLAGVLLEMSAEVDRVAWVVAGVGVNVSPRVARHEGAAYLADRAPERRVPEVAAAVLDGIARSYRRWQAEGFSPVAHEFNQRHLLANREVEVHTTRGDLAVAGRVVGIDETGRLLVETAGEIVALSAGDVTLRKQGKSA